MSALFKGYRAKLRQAAKGIPIALFTSNLWSGFGEALKEVFQTLLLAITSIVLLATYPVSVFLIAALGCLSDRRIEKARSRFVEQMNRQWKKAKP